MSVGLVYQPFGIDLFGLEAGVAAGPPVVVPPVGRDWDIYEDIEARLEGTGEFGEGCVQIGHPDDFDELFPDDRSAVALVTPDSWGRANDDRVDEELRTGGYTLTIVVREQSPRRRYQTLDRLAAASQNVLDGQPLAGITYRSMTKLTRGDYGVPRDSEQRLTMHDEYRYRVIGHDAHDATEREGV